MQVTTCTSHFQDRLAAYEYYRSYGFSRKDVDNKIREGEIYIGPPPRKEGETLHVNKEGRYCINHAPATAIKKEPACPVPTKRELKLVDEKMMGELERRKEELTEKYYNDLYNMYKPLIEDAIRWFKEKYPKRTIQWMDGMGTNFWILDGEILHWDVVTQKFDGNWDIVYVDAEPDRKAKRLMPLWNIYQSINEVTNVASYQGIPAASHVRMEDV